MSVYQSQQDRLDDLIWLLYRSVEWGITISADHREEMKCDARALISDIYANRQNEINSNLHGDIWMLIMPAGTCGAIIRDNMKVALSGKLKIAPGSIRRIYDAQGRKCTT